MSKSDTTSSQDARAPMEVAVALGNIPRRERLEAQAAATGEMYFSREKIHPREVDGLFARLRAVSAMALLGAFYLSCWISVDGQQILLFDLPARRFHVFGLTFWPQDFIYLSALLLLAALSLFFFTAVAGRLWCGYACPQTAWTEMFMWVERVFEGTASRRRKLEARPWDRGKLLRKGGKHLSWVVLSLFTGFTFVGYFTPVRELALGTVAFTLGPWEYFWIGFYGVATWGNAGFLREQVCKYMCPYARFQSAMFDRDTLVISYDRERGEPRGSRRRGQDPAEAGLGSCIDCQLCVQVCPTGIDIRDGLQYECIGCAACVDVCDQVMDKMHYPRGLVRYTTHRAQESRGPVRLIRPRVVIYATLIIAVTAAVIFTLLGRTPLLVDVMRDRNALYREVPGLAIENVYQVRLMNMDDQSHRYRIEAQGLAGARVVQPVEAIEVASGGVQTVALRLQVPSGNLVEPSMALELHVQALDEPRISRTERTRFLGPARP